jgi:hypothetical protein
MMQRFFPTTHPLSITQRDISGFNPLGKINHGNYYRKILPEQALKTPKTAKEWSEKHPG